MAMVNLTIDSQETDHPGFFKFFQSDHAKQMILPSDFIRSLPKQLPKQVFIRDRHNNLWQVKVGILENGTYFQDGWVTFIEDNLVKRGELLMFEYFCYGMFSVKIFDESACEKKGVEKFICKRIEWKEDTTEKNEHKEEVGEYNADDEKIDDKNEDTVDGSTDDKDIEMVDEDNVKIEDEDGGEEIEEDNVKEVGALVEGDEEGIEIVGEDYIKKEQEEDGEHIDEEHVDEEDLKDDVEGWEEEEEDEDEDEENHEESGNEENGREKTRRKKRIIDIYGTELFRSGLAIKPTNPYFLTRITNRKSALYIPLDFLSQHSSDLEKVTYLVTPLEVGTEWDLKYRTWKGGRANYTGGWRRFCQRYVRKDRMCICELVKGQRGPYIKVSIAPANR